MSSETRSRRCATWTAISDLRSLGYICDRCIGKDRNFDIIAWNRDSILGLLVRAARTASIRTFQEEISKISTLAQERMTPGSAELWLYHPGGRQRYQILPGGAIIIRETGV